MTDHPDYRPTMTAAFNQAAAVIAAVQPEDLDRPTPCAGSDVGTLVGHLLAVADRIGAMPGSGQLTTGPTFMLDEVPSDPGPTFARRADEAVRVWADDALLSRSFAVPWGEHSGAEAVAGFVLELTMHSWDVAVAVGYDRPLDADLGDVVLGVAHQILPPGPRGGHVPFDAPVDVDDDADVYRRLAGWLGRKPLPHS